MMKKLYVLLLIMSMTRGVYGQTVCPPNGITTNPNAPVNIKNPKMINDFFDWTQEEWADYMHTSYYGNGGAEPSFPTVSPFWSPENYLEYLSGANSGEETIDYAPEEGWELITRSLGKLKDGEQYTSFYFPYVILYNKYMGKMRMLYSIPSSSIGNHNSILARIRFNQPSDHDDINVTGLFGHNEGLSQPLDQKSISFVEAIDNITLKGWNHAEFVVAYDPCTCVKQTINGEEILLNPTSLFVEIDLIETSTLAMTGRLLGTATSPYFTGNSYNGTELTTVLKNGVDHDIGVETFREINSLYSKVDDFESDNNDAFNAFVGLVSDFTSAFPVVEGILNVINDDNKNLLKLIGSSSKYATSTLKGLQAEKKALPSIMDGEIAASGEITSERADLRAEFIFENPGAADDDGDDDEDNTIEFGTSDYPSYPFYNEVLGNFALLETPDMNRGTSEYDDLGFDNAVYDVFKLDETSLKYLMNPALDINYQNTKILGSLIFDVDRQFNGNITPPPFALGASYMYDKDLSKSVFFSPFLPLECLGNTTVQLLNNFDDGPINYDGVYVEKVYLRLMIFYQFHSLDRDGNPNANVLTLTYPIDVPLQEMLGTLVNELSNVTAKKTLTTTNFTTSQDVQAYNTITVTGNLTAASGVTVNLVANEVILEPGATLGPGVNIRLGIPTACGSPLAQYPFHQLGSYCTSNTYKAKTPKNVFIAEEVQPETTPSVMFLNAPNPFTESTDLRFEITEDHEISIVVYNMLGQEVETVLAPTELGEGTYNYSLDGIKLTPGIYLATLRTHGKKGFSQTIKIVKQ